MLLYCLFYILIDSSETSYYYQNINSNTIDNSAFDNICI